MAADGLQCYKIRALLLIISMLGAQIDTSSAFLSPNADQIQSSHFVDHHRHLRSSTARCAADDSGEENSEDPKEGLGFTALPPIGASSFWDRPQDENANANTNDLSQADSSNTKKNGIIISEHTNLVSAKFQIQYTCKKCLTRNSHMVTRVAYRNGVVIAQCKGCVNKHLIADNLGWSNYIGGFDFDNGETDIEMYMKNRDQEARENGVVGEKENDLVMRVNQEVFDLENILYKGKEENMSPAKGTNEGDQVGDVDETSWS
mmetsp:Transcript_14689/g.31917  ORF Transcript_14689/g.31917 Transcript_14689/m.31917 type:complete len:261 (+) Transcript_14689:51-833(+)